MVRSIFSSSDSSTIITFPAFILACRNSFISSFVETDTTVSRSNSGNSDSAILKPSIEWRMHASIYNKLSKVNAVVHSHSPYTLAIAISLNGFQHIIEEAKIVVGNPIIIPNKPSGSNIVSNAFFEGENKQEEQVRAVIIRNHGIVSIGNNIHQARAVIESIEEWAKIYTISKIFGGPKYVL
jgi:L-fuculose-phosphate aldolase